MRRSTLSYNVTSATYNGISLSAVPSSCRRENSTGASIIAFYLANPPQGSNTISTTGGSGSSEARYRLLAPIMEPVPDLPELPNYIDVRENGSAS